MLNYSRLILIENFNVKKSILINACSDLIVDINIAFPPFIS